MYMIYSITVLMKLSFTRKLHFLKIQITVPVVVAFFAMYYLYMCVVKPVAVLKHLFVQAQTQ